jgi:hypothetical protein
LLRDSLCGYDPLRLGSGGIAKEEYGSPVATIIPRLETCATPEQFRFVIEDEMRMHYPTADLTSTDWAKLTTACWNIWLDFQQRRQ